MFTKVGFELEDFVFLDGELVDLSKEGVPHDDCPYLVEYRGQEADTPLKAKHNLLYEIERVKGIMDKRVLYTKGLYEVQITKEQRRHLRRVMNKGPMKQYRIGGGIKLPKPGLLTAGLHVHFSNSYETTYGNKAEDSYKVTIHRPMNIPRIVYMMDKEFSGVIKEAKRQSGLYEMKTWGFEYRSLPADVDLDRVVKALKTIQGAS